jgi:hypothetical protein
MWKGYSDNVGDEFTFRVKDIHYSRMKASELIPNEKVVMLVLDNLDKNSTSSRTRASGWVGRSPSKSHHVAINSKSASPTPALCLNARASTSVRMHGAHSCTAACEV